MQYGHIWVMTTRLFWLCMLVMMILDGPGHQESTARPLEGPLSHGTAGAKIIRDSKYDGEATALSMNIKR